MNEWMNKFLGIPNSTPIADNCSRLSIKRDNFYYIQSFVYNNNKYNIKYVCYLY